MSQVKVSAIVDTSGGNTVTINGYTLQRRFAEFMAQEARIKYHGEFARSA